MERDVRDNKVSARSQDFNRRNSGSVPGLDQSSIGLSDVLLLLAETPSLSILLLINVGKKGNTIGR
jgi:hypothetical protein